MYQIEVKPNKYGIRAQIFFTNFSPYNSEFESWNEIPYFKWTEIYRTNIRDSISAFSGYVCYMRNMRCSWPRNLIKLKNSHGKKWKKIFRGRISRKKTSSTTRRQLMSMFKIMFRLLLSNHRIGKKTNRHLHTSRLLKQQ